MRRRGTGVNRPLTRAWPAGFGCGSSGRTPASAGPGSSNPSTSCSAASPATRRASTLHRPGDQFSHAGERQVANPALLEPVHPDEAALPVRDRRTARISDLPVAAATPLFQKTGSFGLTCSQSRLLSGFETLQGRRRGTIREVRGIADCPTARSRLRAQSQDRGSAMRVPTVDRRDR